MARALDDLPAITDAFATGRLSHSQVRALTRVAEPATEADLVMIARHATAAQLERLVRSYRGVLRRGSETDRANDRHARRSLSYHWDDDGSLVGSFRLDPEEGAVLVAALEAASGRSAEPPEDDLATRTADRPAAARRADALVAMAERLPGGEVTAPGGDRYQVVVHVDAPVLADDVDGRCEIANGPALAPETARRLSCDGAVMTMVDAADGTPLDVGRKTRRIPARLRRAVLARDGVCVFPGCDRPITEIHHRKHWANGGATELRNLDGQCKFHHRLVHESGWNIERNDAGRAVFRRPDGAILETDPLRVESADGRIEAANFTAESLPLPTLVRPAATGIPSTSTGRSPACAKPANAQLPSLAARESSSVVRGPSSARTRGPATARRGGGGCRSLRVGPVGPPATPAPGRGRGRTWHPDR